MFETTIDRAMYDHPGKQTTMTYAVRRYRDRPALAVGQPVTIVRFHADSDRYSIKCRVLVRTESGAERWVNGSDVEPIRDPADDAAFARMGEIATEFFARRD